MLSQANQISNVDRRNQPRHTRQQSTPTTFEDQDMVHLQPTPITSQGEPVHRRGISLHHGIPMVYGYPPQHGGAHMVGITNTGQETQHFTQVAQQHCQALPGLPEHQLREIEAIRRRKDEESKLEIASYIRQSNATRSFGPVTGQQQIPMERSRSNPFDGSNMRPSHENNASSNDSVTPSRSFGTHNPYSMKRPSTSGSNANFANSTSQRPDWQMHSQQRHATPEKRSSIAFISPQTSPYQLVQTSHRPQSPDPECYELMDTSKTWRPAKTPEPRQPMLMQMFESPAQSSPDYMDCSTTIRGRPAPLPAVPLSNMFAEHGNQESLPSPPGAQELPQNSFQLMSGQVVRMPSHYAQSTFEATMSPMQYTTPLAKSAPKRGRSKNGSIASQPAHSPMMSTYHCHGDSTSFEMITSPEDNQGSPEGLLEDLDLDATQEDTGITAEDVQRFISGADPDDGRWSCLWDGCDKRFGRKENVRAHVQTHLGDRQYKCPVCHNRFVRQHDLKRHLKTHSDSKPYPCACGRDFARQDALTRHRQRNSCCGGLAGFAKETRKRGRPKKERPTLDDRADKAAMTRKRRTRQQQSYPSSVSGGSDDGSQGQSPRSENSELVEMELTKYDEDVRRMRSLTLRPQDPEVNSSPPECKSHSPLHEPCLGYSPSSSHFGSVGDSPPPLECTPPRALRFEGIGWFDNSQIREEIEAPQLSPTFSLDSHISSTEDFEANDFFGNTLDEEPGWKGGNNDFNLDSFLQYPEEEPPSFTQSRYAGGFDEMPILSDGLEPMDFNIRT